MSDGGLTPQEFADENVKAEEAGFRVRFGDDRTLLIDLDDPESIQSFRNRLPKFAELFGVGVLEDYESSSGPGHRHVILSLPEPHVALFRIAMQAALGSDWLRETLSLRRLANGVLEPSRLFRKKT